MIYLPALKTWTVFFSLTVVSAVVAPMIGIATIVGGFLFLFGINLLTWYFSREILSSIWSVRELRRGQEVDGVDLYKVVDQVLTHARDKEYGSIFGEMSLSYDQIKIYISDSTEANAFATGRSKTHAMICVNRGLLAKLKDKDGVLDEQALKGILCHELGHVLHSHVLWNLLAVSMVNFLDMVHKYLEATDKHEASVQAQHKRELIELAAVEKREAAAQVQYKRELAAAEKHEASAQVQHNRELAERGVRHGNVQTESKDEMHTEVKQEEQDLLSKYRFLIKFAIRVMVWTFGSMLSRQCEYDADNVAARAGYGAGLKRGLAIITEGHDWLTTYSANGRGKFMGTVALISEFFTSHPNVKNRIAAIDVAMKEYDSCYTVGEDKGWLKTLCDEGRAALAFERSTYLVHYRNDMDVAKILYPQDTHDFSGEVQEAKFVRA